MAVAIRVEHFNGPLDLLLQLVETEKLDITRISLARVVEQFVSHVHENPQIPPQELADYLLIAAKLVYMKSKLLIPSLYDEDLEEGPDLESQLREYRRFVKAAKAFELLWMNDRILVSRPEPMRVRREGFQFPSGVSASILFETMRRIIARLIPNEEIPKARMKRVVTIQQKIQDLLSRIRSHAKTTFHEFCEGLSDRGEAVVSFLALLELEKQRHIVATQDMTFADIQLDAHPDAPGDVLATDSYI